MPDIRPFAGVRYRLKNPSDLGNFAAPPYDMLDEKFTKALYAKHELNCVRLIQNLKEPQDAANKDRHVRAGKLYTEWRKKGILQQDSAPSFYVYAQQFSVPVAGTMVKFERLGVIATVKTVPFSDGVVLPHEYTFSGPKADRYELLETIKTETGMIFGIIDDKTGDFYSYIAKARSGSPLGTFTDSEGTVHALYRIVDQAVMKKFVESAQGRTVLIADGHHRYETALNYYKNTGNPAASHCLMTLVSTRDPGLVILSFHRLIRKCKYITSFGADRLSKFFSMTDLGPATQERVNGFMDKDDGFLLLWADSATRKLYGLNINKAGEEFLKANADGKSDSWTHLSASVINLLILKGLLSIDITDSLVLHDVLDFSNKNDVAFQKGLDASDCYGTIFLRPVTIDTISSVVARNERMPQKSTCFFPKLWSGLVFYSLEPSA
jgi:uncharacterized protein (DUF1015 family)